MKRLILSSLLIAAFLGTAGLIAAHGGGDLIARSVAVGPYFASVWVNPPDPRAEEPIHFTVGLAAPDDGRPVLDADIMVTMRDKEDGTTVATAPAETEQSINKLFYETDIEVPAAGEYETEFQIQGAEGGDTFSIVVEVQDASAINWLVVGLAGLGLVVLGGWWRSRKSATGR